MRPIAASLVLRGIAVVLGGAGLTLLALGVSKAMAVGPASVATATTSPAGAISVSIAWTIAGVLILLVGLVGPLRIVVSGALIPAEVRQALIVQAVCFPVAGLALAVAGVLVTPGVQAVALVISGACALTSSLAGFYRLSTRLPPTFYIEEMAAIMKSAGLMGSKQDSPADREFMRWSKGVREGVRVGNAAPDGPVITLDGEETTLASFLQPEGGASLVVLNFGSYSCPHHRKRFDELQALMDKWQPRGMRFLTIYTTEAHPEDGWRLENQYANDPEYTGNPDDFCFSYAKTLDDRRHMAQWMIDKSDFRMPVVLDSMDDTLLAAYNSWPIRLYVINSGQVVFSGKQGPFGYAPGEVDEWLERYGR